MNSSLSRLIPSDDQELVMTHYIQTHIHSLKDLPLIDYIINDVYRNTNVNLITPLSLLENDELLAYLFTFIIDKKSTLSTQNIMYLLKYMNRNISFLLLISSVSFIVAFCWKEC